MSSLDNDIYEKGALFLYTLRAQLNNDELFFKALREAQQKFARTNTSTDQFQNFFNTAVQHDFKAYFEVYLKGTQPPVLEWCLDSLANGKQVLKYKWGGHLPADFSMKIPLTTGGKTYLLLPEEKLQQIILESKTDKIRFDLPHTGYVLFRQKKLK